MSVLTEIVGKDQLTVAEVKTSVPVGTEAGLYVRVVSQPAAGGGGGPATIVDGGDVAEGSTTDAAVTTDVNGTISGKLRGLVKMLADVWDSVNHRLNIYVQNASIAVTGTFYQAVQPVSATSLPLPTGAALDASLTTIDTDLKATQPRDVTDRAARLLGHVTVDATPNPLGVATPLLTVVTASAQNVTLLAAAASRQGAIIRNESSRPLYIKFGAVATRDDYTDIIPPGRKYRLDAPVYSGQIDGIWLNGAADGQAHITTLAP